MKLQQLPDGARFEYQGRVFVKTGPLTARSENGGQQIIPRSATLKALDPPAPEQTSAGRGKLSESLVLSAFDTFYRTSTRLIDAASRPALEEARDRFLATLQ
ncbi:hypothetical protein ACLIKD_07925 [Azonexus sp. IMCC34842]|uniref:hypothetical protein n=1 Tax=Azonexus sp. IMCC34842 TaxID=3420950 RepID=UPI003D11C7A7